MTKSTVLENKYVNKNTMQTNPKQITPNLFYLLLRKIRFRLDMAFLDLSETNMFISNIRTKQWYSVWYYKNNQTKRKQNEEKIRDYR